MGRPKRELKQVHAKKVKKAKKKLRLLAKGECTHQQLNQRAKKLLRKRKKRS